jgi:hypothetical protein
LELAPIGELAELLKISADAAQRLIEGEKTLRPHSVKVGDNKTMSLYDKDLALRTLTPKVAALKLAPAEQPASAAVLAAVGKVGADVEQLNELAGAIDENAVKIVEDVAKLLLQGPALLKAIEAASAKLDRATELLVALEAKGAAPAPAAPEESPGQPPLSTHKHHAPGPAKPLVVIAGLHSQEKNSVQQEFGSLLELHMFTPQEAEGPAFSNRLKAASAVYVFYRICSPRTMAAIKTARFDKFTRIDGSGLTKLRAKLEEFATEPAPA